MELSDVLRQRRFVRHYREDPVDPAALRRIMEVVRRAPSAGFSQGQRVTVITEPGLRARIAALSEGYYVERGYQPWLSQAPVHLVIGVVEDAYHQRYQEADKVDHAGDEKPWPVPFWWFDVGALCMLLQLAAIDEGLATGIHSPGNVAELEEFGRLAGFPPGTATVGVMTMGHSAADNTPNPRITQRRKPIDDLVTWIT